MRFMVLGATGLALALAACSGSGGSGSKGGLYHPDVGPFDKDGNYVEALADAPVRKNHFARSKSKPKKVRAPKKQKQKRLAKAKVKAPKREKVSRAARTPATPQVVSRRVISRTVTPVKPATPPRSIVLSRSGQSEANPRLAAVPRRGNTTQRPAPAVVTPPKPKPKPAAVVMKPKTKAPVRHRVTGSDTLYGLSRKYGKSVASIKAANALRSNTIITGSTLLIPQ